MSKLKFFLVLLTCSVVWAVPFKVEVLKNGDGDPIRAGQLIQVHYKGYLAADSALVNQAATDTTVEVPYFANSYYSGVPLATVSLCRSYSYLYNVLFLSVIIPLH